MPIFNSQDGTRYKITVLLIFAICFLSLAVMILAAIGKNIPEVVGAAVLGGLINQLGMAVQGYFRGREDWQAAEIESKKNGPTK